MKKLKKQSIFLVMIMIGMMPFINGCGEKASVVHMDSEQSTTDTASDDKETSKEADIKPPQGDDEDEKGNKVPQEGEAETGTQAIYVHVCGAVNHPGVYQLPALSRVFQAIEMAGGFTAEAAGSTVNLADEVSDGQQIFVLTQEEVLENPPEIASGATGDTQTEVGEIKININTADVSGLCELTGIGESKALEIIRYREESGPFGAVEELKNVSGIGDKTFEKIKDQITIS